MAVAQLSLQDTVNIAQEATAKGGKMRVATGFLRASGQGSLNGMPTGPGRGDRTEPNSYPENSGAVVAVIGKLKLGQTFFFGWTANYAEYREIYDGFLESALQQWTRIVAFHVDAVRDKK